MYQVYTSSLSENSVINNDLYDQDGNILLLRGTRLKPRIIEFLKQNGINSVFLLTQPESQAPVPIRDDSIDNQMFEQPVNAESLLQKHTEPGTIPLEILDSLHRESRTLFQRLPVDGKIDLESIRYLASEAADFMMEVPSTSLKLNDLMFFRGDLPTHSVNVAVLSLFVGREFDLARRHLRDLALGALLHDVGLTAFGIDSSHNINRTFAESASPIPIGTHPETGVRLLRKNRIRDEALLNIVYNHHERHDGLGYPRKLQGSQIPLTSAVVSLANDFVTLSSTAAQGGIMPGSRVMSHLMRDIEKAYSPDAASGFIRTVGIYPVGSFLLLSSGEIGIVVDNPSGSVLTPRLMLIRNSKGEDIAEPVYADLADGKSIFVTQVLSPAQEVRYGSVDRQWPCRT